jgi:predicted RNA-binding Zn ribbon-like protein
MATTPETIHLWGGALCLDFANSADWSSGGEPVDPQSTDALRTPEMLGRWGVRLDVLDAARVDDVDARELERAREIRDVVHRVFTAIAGGGHPEPGDVVRLAGDYAEATAAGRLAGPPWRFDWPPGDPRRIRFAVVADAVALLLDPARLGRVCRCPGSGCGWLFINASGRRRWCSMSTCGSRDKMRRLYARRRASGGR